VILLDSVAIGFRLPSDMPDPDNISVTVRGSAPQPIPAPGLKAARVLLANTHSRQHQIAGRRTKAVANMHRNHRWQRRQAQNQG